MAPTRLWRLCLSACLHEAAAVVLHEQKQPRVHPGMPIYESGLGMYASLPLQR